MSTIIASPLHAEDTSEPSRELIQLQILVQEEDWYGLFDRIEVWRSRTVSSGPYEELTGSKWAPARVPKDAPDAPASAVTGTSAVLVGKDLQLQVNEQDDLVVVFTGSDPLTYAQAATQVIAQGGGRVTSYVAPDGTFTVQSVDFGTGAVLEITGGDAAALLGLPTEEPESLSFGSDPRISLKKGVQSYSFTDVRGSDAYFYKTRFRNSSTQGVSEFSQPFSVGQALGVGSANVVKGVMDLVGLDGRPISNMEVVVHNHFNGTLTEGKYLSQGVQRKLTNTSGHVEFFLVRGMRVTVVITGTDIVRDITVPVDADISVFQLLGADAAVSNDHWKVQVPVLKYAQKRSL